MISSARGFSLSSSLIWTTPLRDTISPAPPPVETISAKTSLAMDPEMLPLSTRASSSVSMAGVTFSPAMDIPCSLSALSTSVMIQLLISFGASSRRTHSS